MPVAVSFIRFFSNSPFFSLFILPQKFETLSQMLIGNGQLLSLLAKEARWYREKYGGYLAPSKKAKAVTATVALMATLA